MKKNISLLTKFNQLSPEELLLIRGGRRLFGPGDTVADDIDMPDITNLPGPGDTVADDIDMPDITLSNMPMRRFGGTVTQIRIFS